MVMLSVHYCGVYAIFASPVGKLIKLLLALSVFEGEQCFGSNAHCKLLEDTLEQYNRTKNSIIFITADNCSTNKSLVKIIDVPMIGCFSHRLNLAVQLFCNSSIKITTVLDKIRVLMVFLKTPKARGWLIQYTSLAPSLDNDTRWDSKYAMLKKYVRLVPVLSNKHRISLSEQQIKEEEDAMVTQSKTSSSESDDTNDNDYVPAPIVNTVIDHNTIRSFLLTDEEEKTIETLSVVLKDCKSVSKRLQKKIAHYFWLQHCLILWLLNIQV